MKVSQFVSIKILYDKDIQFWLLFNCMCECIILNHKMIERDVNSLSSNHQLQNLLKEKKNV